MRNFKLLYRVLGSNGEDSEDCFDPVDGIKSHEEKSINLVIGMTGSGKTSMIQILAGGEQTNVRTKSDTQDPVLVFDKANDKLWMDTGGMCDSSEDSKHKALLRDSILDAIKTYRFKVGRIFVCVASDQNMNVQFAHEYIAFKEAFPGADCFTRVVITKVNRSTTFHNINAEGGLKTQYASAFNCSEDQVLIHGYDNFNNDVLPSAVGPSSSSGIRFNVIREVQENKDLLKSIEELKLELEKINSLMKNKQSDKEQIEEKLQALHNMITAAEETLEHLISTNRCGRNNGAISSAVSDISRIQIELKESEKMLHENKVSTSEASWTCDRLHMQILDVKKDLGARIKGGLGLANLAGAKSIYLNFFANE